MFEQIEPSIAMLQFWQSPEMAISRNQRIYEIELIAPIRRPICQNLAQCLCFRYVLSFFAMSEQIEPSIAMLQFWQFPEMAISKNQRIYEIEPIALIRLPICQNLAQCLCFRYVL